MDRKYLVPILLLVAFACASFGGPPQINRSRDPGALHKNQNLLDIPVPATARSNLSVPELVDTNSSFTKLIATDTAHDVSIAAGVASDVLTVASFTAFKATDTQLLASMTAVEATNTLTIASFTAFKATDTQLLASLSADIASQTLTDASMSVAIASLNAGIASPGASLTAALDPAGRTGSSTQDFNVRKLIPVFATYTYVVAFCDGVGVVQDDVETIATYSTENYDFLNEWSGTVFTAKNEGFYSAYADTVWSYESTFVRGDIIIYSSHAAGDREIGILTSSAILNQPHHNKAGGVFYLLAGETLTVKVQINAAGTTGLTATGHIKIARVL